MFPSDGKSVADSASRASRAAEAAVAWIINARRINRRGLSQMLEAESPLNVQKPIAGAQGPVLATGLRAAGMEQATLGATMVVKGELSGSQAFYVDGRVEGSIHFPKHRVTIGRGAVVQASIEAREIVIMGTVTGNIECGDRVDIRGEAVLTGDVVTQRISIDEGALVKGSVEVRKVGKADALDAGSKTKPETAGKGEPAKPDAATVGDVRGGMPEKAVPTVPASIPAEMAKAAAAAASSTTQASTFRMSGSKVLFEEKK
jgi:cytoskeletal protein CcmA (bactofilin family)